MGVARAYQAYPQCTCAKQYSRVCGVVRYGQGSHLGEHAAVRSLSLFLGLRDGALGLDDLVLDALCMCVFGEGCGLE